MDSLIILAILGLFFWLLRSGHTDTPTAPIDDVGPIEILEAIRRYSNMDTETAGILSASVYKWGIFYSIDPFLILAIIQRESSFRPRADGADGERGLMQVMPIAMKQYGQVYRQAVDWGRMYEIDYNIKVGAGYYAWCKDLSRNEYRQVALDMGIRERALLFYNDGFRDRPKGRTYARLVMDNYRRFISGVNTE